MSPSSASSSAPPPPTPQLPRRTSSLFEKSGQTVRRLARKLSVGVLRARPSSSLNERDAGYHSSGSTFSEVPSQISGVGRSTPSARPVRHGAGSGFGRITEAVVEEEDEEDDGVIASKDKGRERERGKRGGGDRSNRGPPVGDRSVGGTRMSAPSIPWKIPKAQQYRHSSGGPTTRKADYDVAPLLYGQKVRELWFPSGDTLVYLCNKGESERYGPSFRLPSSTLRQKSEFFSIALSNRWQDTSTAKKGEAAKFSLYFPPWGDEDGTDSRGVKTEEELHDLLDELLATRNLFAYLFGRFCIALPTSSQVLGDLMDRIEMYILSSATDISGRGKLLQELEPWIRNHGLDDARDFPKRIVDVLVISERYHWEAIFTEAFCHGAGLYDTLSLLPEFLLLSPKTRQLLERGNFTTKLRVSAMTNSFAAFDFPVLPSASYLPTSSSRKVLSPDSRAAYRQFRIWITAYYTQLFHVKHWPPKKWTRGMVLQLRKDFGALYELLVYQQASSAANIQEFGSSSLAQVLLAFDEAWESSLSNSINTKHNIALPKVPTQKKGDGKKMTREAVAVALMDSYNLPSSTYTSPFVEGFKEFERAYGSGKTLARTVAAREGRWCFIYAVWRTLRVVCDEWEGLRWDWGVEYWLCAERKGVPPWRVEVVVGGVDQEGRGGGAASKVTGAGTGAGERGSSGEEVEDSDDEEEDEDEE